MTHFGEIDLTEARRSLEYSIYVQQKNFSPSAKQLYTSVELAMRLKRFQYHIGKPHNRGSLLRLGKEIVNLVCLFIEAFFLPEEWVTNEKISLTFVPTKERLDMINLAVIKASTLKPWIIVETPSLVEQYRKDLSEIVKLVSHETRLTTQALRTSGRIMFELHLRNLSEMKQMGLL